MSKQSIAFAGALAFALIVAGCGNSESGVPTAQITKATFLKEADAICARSYQRVRSGFQAFVKGRESNAFSDPQSVTKYADTILIPAKRQEVKELRALGAPSGDEDEVEAIVNAYEEGIETAEDDPQAAVISAQGVFVRATELAEEYGLEDCYY